MAAQEGKVPRRVDMDTDYLWVALGYLGFGTDVVRQCEVRSRAEYCFDSIVSEKRTH